MWYGIRSRLVALSSQARVQCVASEVQDRSQDPANLCDVTFDRMTALARRCPVSTPGSTGPPRGLCGTLVSPHAALP